MYNERLEKYYNISKINLNKSNLKKNLWLNKTLGSGFYGIVKKYNLKKNIKTSLAIKEISYAGDDQLSEIKTLQECTKLVINKNVLNLPILYNYFIDKKIYLFLEYYEVNMMEWCKNKYTIEEWNYAYFQIFSGLYSLEKYTNIYLGDIKFENILVKKIKNNHIHYIIDNNIYFLLNCEYLFVLSDFGITYPKYDATYYSTERISNNYIRSTNIHNCKNKEDIIILFKKIYKNKYINFYNESKNNIDSGKIIINMQINGINASVDEKIVWFVSELIFKYIGKYKYNKFMKKYKDVFIQQPYQIIKKFNNLENINFTKLFPILFEKYIKNDNNLKYKLNILDTYIL